MNGRRHDAVEMISVLLLLLLLPLLFPPHLLVPSTTVRSFFQRFAPGLFLSSVSVLPTTTSLSHQPGRKIKFLSLDFCLLRPRRQCLFVPFSHGSLLRRGCRRSKFQWTNLKKISLWSRREKFVFLPNGFPLEIFHYSNCFSGEWNFTSRVTSSASNVAEDETMGRRFRYHPAYNNGSRFWENIHLMNFPNENSSFHLLVLFCPLLRWNRRWSKEE